MARNKMFDNLMKYVRREVTATSNTAAPGSAEVNLNLPRGFVAKIKKVIFEVVTIGADLDTLGAADVQFECALVNDPDDQTTFEAPDNEVSHDVIADWHYNFLLYLATSGGAFAPPLQKVVEFDQELDVIAARNMRLNAFEGSASSGTIIGVGIYYTLEKVTSQLLLELLDIL